MQKVGLKERKQSESDENSRVNSSNVQTEQRLFRISLVSETACGAGHTVEKEKEIKNSGAEEAAKKK
jgi:Ser-tRNA(Ala) deacylase AlaX